jgi:hypothetical protein
MRRSLVALASFVALVSLLFLAVAPAFAATSHQVNNGASLAITEFAACRLVTNNHASGLAIFVPTATSGEWSAFYGNVPAGVSAVVCDTTPDAFSFTDQTGVALNTLTTSNSLTITGVNVPTSVSVSGQGSPQISINGGAWGTSGTITNSQTLQVRLTSSASPNTASNATVTVGTGSDNWSVTTTGAVFNPARANCSTNNGGPFALAGSYDTPGTTYWVWGDGTYVYVADGDSGISAYTFNGSTFTFKGSYDPAGKVYTVWGWGDGTYIYVAAGTDGVLAFTFNGATFTLKGSYDTGTAEQVWGDGTYLYVADDTGFYALAFSGSAFALRGSYAAGGAPNGVWGDGSYIHVANLVYAIQPFSFDGTTISHQTTYSFGSGNDTYEVWGDGNYIYTASTANLYALTFNGSSYTVKGQYSTGTAQGVWADGQYIYVSNATSGVTAFTFNGSSFTIRNTYDTPGTAKNAWGDGTYIYVADFDSGIEAFSGFACTSAH